MKSRLVTLTLTLGVLLSPMASATQLDDLLQQVKQQQAKNQQVQNQREADFAGDLAHWRKELATAQARFN